MFCVVKVCCVMLIVFLVCGLVMLNDVESGVLRVVFMSVVVMFVGVMGCISKGGMIVLLLMMVYLVIIVGKLWNCVVCMIVKGMDFVVILCFCVCLL